MLVEGVTGGRKQHLFLRNIFNQLIQSKSHFQNDRKSDNLTMAIYPDFLASDTLYLQPIQEFVC